MNILRSFSVVAALCLTSAAYAQSQIPSMRVAAASPSNVDSGMRVKSRSGDLLGTVASIVPGHSNSEGYVVIANPQGIATPVPYGTASALVQHGALVVDKSRFLNAPKVQEYQTEDGSSTVWEQKADQYWKPYAMSSDQTSGVLR
jgi:hypothetical protein